MGAIVVQHQMDIEIDGNGVVDSLQEIQKLHRTMAPVTLTEDTAGGDIESRKQAGDAMPLVVMRAPLSLSDTHGQHRLYTPEPESATSHLRTAPARDGWIACMAHSCVDADAPLDGEGRPNCWQTGAKMTRCAFPVPISVSRSLG
jgi:hypothetical protein